jgi:hypothetical protein
MKESQVRERRGAQMRKSEAPNRANQIADLLVFSKFIECIVLYCDICSNHPEDRRVRVFQKEAERRGVSDSVRQGLLRASELWQMSEDEFRALYDEHLAERAREEAAQRELRAFYNQPGSRFKLQHWARADCWNLEEGVALCLGKDPRIVNSETLKPYAEFSEFAQRFFDALDLARRARKAGNLPPPTRPHEFLAWADRVGFGFPEELKQAVEDAGRVVDCKAKCQELEETSSRKVAELEAQVASLKEKLDKSESIMTTQKRTTFMKFFAVLVNVAYGYNTHDPNSRSPISEIASDFAVRGVKINHKTIYEWLKEASEYFRPDWQSRGS